MCCKMTKSAPVIIKWKSTELVLVDGKVKCNVLVSLWLIELPGSSRARYYRFCYVCL